MISEQDYYRDVLAINSANLATNLEIMNVNHEIMYRGRDTDREIIYLLKRILEVLLKNDRE